MHRLYDIRSLGKGRGLGGGGGGTHEGLSLYCLGEFCHVGFQCSFMGYEFKIIGYNSDL